MSATEQINCRLAIRDKYYLCELARNYELFCLILITMSSNSESLFIVTKNLENAMYVLIVMPLMWTMCPHRAPRCYWS